jgi:thymidylate synthase
MIPAPKVIQGISIGETHDMIMCALIKEGCMNDMDTEDDEYTWEYPSPIISHVTDPLNPPFVSEASKFGPKFLEKYREQLLTLTPPRADGKGFSYTYANRLFDYPVKVKDTGDDEIWVGDGHGGGFNQIDGWVIKKLKLSSMSRRAVAITWVPEIDVNMDEPPCVDVVQFLLRDDALRLVAYIRSNDMLMAWPQNMNGLAGLLEYVAKNVGVSHGSVTTMSVSAHLYAHRDSEDLNAFRKHLQKKGMLCERR